MKMSTRYYKVVDTSCSEQHGELSLTPPDYDETREGPSVTVAEFSASVFNPALGLSLPYVAWSVYTVQ